MSNGLVNGERLLDQVKERINYIWHDAGDFFALGTISDGTFVLYICNWHPGNDSWLVG